MNLPVLDESGSSSGEVTLEAEIFGAKVNVPLMHQVVVAQLAAARAGTHATKTRAQVAGGGRKPYRQKGTGRARHGSIREPQWVGGGTAHGPGPRDYGQSVNKKMKAGALRSALSARASEGKVVVVGPLEFDVPKTKRALAALSAWNVTGKALLVLGASEASVGWSFRNLGYVHIVEESQLNVYDVLEADTVVFTRVALDAFQVRMARLPGRRAAEHSRSEAAGFQDIVLESAPGGES